MSRFSKENNHDFRYFRILQITLCINIFPIAYFDSHYKIICSYPSSTEQLDLYSVSLPSLQKKQRNPDYFITNTFAYYGIIRICRNGGFLTLGPLFSTTVSDSVKRNFLQKCAIPTDYKSLLTQFLSDTPLISFHQFLAVLTPIHYCINDENLHYGSNPCHPKLHCRRARY